MAQSPLWNLPDELWTRSVLPQVRDGELLRLRRVSRSARELVSRHPELQARVDAELARRTSAREEDRSSKRWVYTRGNTPAIVLRALEGDIAGVQAQLEAGVDVDACARWVEIEDRWWSTDKTWTWNRDTALSMACSQGNTQLVTLLLEAGANPGHRVCNTEDKHYSPADAAAQNGHTLCAEYVSQALERRRAEQQAEYGRQRHERAARLRAEAMRLSAAGPPYPALTVKGRRAQDARSTFLLAAEHMRKGEGGEVLARKEHMQRRSLWRSHTHSCASTPRPCEL
mmetsp:Transcript_13348/g.34597  ORF Transcript_13348/g.34597 Transcript_13348/m.34597 type:complete len:285 (+) Transcript_13348:208-1062(+)